MKSVSERTHKRRVQKEATEILKYIGVGGNQQSNQISETTSGSFSVQGSNFNKIFLGSPTSQQQVGNIILPSLSVSPSQFSGFVDSELSECPVLSDIPTFNGTQPSLSHTLGQWAIEHKIPHSALTDLLKRLQKHDSFTNLPCGARTLLKTPRITVTREVKPGKYIHFGLRIGICDVLSRIKGPVQDPTVRITFNIDGLPLFKSSQNQFWPIICCAEIKEFKKLFLVGLYHGNGKPESIEVFFEEFIAEAKSLNKLRVGEIEFSIEIKAFICDSPARAFITQTKGHSGYFGCRKCKVKGTYVNRRVIFNDSNAQQRTNEEFRQRADENHHIGVTPLEALNIDLVNHIPFEYMHLVCLGVTRKLILLWMRGDIGIFRLSSREVDNVSCCLEKLQKFIPVEFCRKPRPLREIDRWKATELRQFLLYTGPVVLRHALPRNRYEHFLCLHLAISILASKENHLKFNGYAGSLLVYFVECFSKLYGLEHMSYNVHGLVHLAQDVRNLGPLDTFSAFPFENYLQIIKKMLRTPNQPLQQIQKRLAERERAISTLNASTNPITWPQFTLHLQSKPLIHGVELPQYKVIKYRKFELRLKQGNDICLLKNGTIIKCDNFATDSVTRATVVIGRKFAEIRNFFITPCESNTFQIFVGKIEPQPTLKKYNIENILKKMVGLPISTTSIVFIPLLHSDIMDSSE